MEIWGGGEWVVGSGRVWSVGEVRGEGPGGGGTEGDGKGGGGLGPGVGEPTRAALTRGGFGGSGEPGSLEGRWGGVVA